MITEKELFEHLRDKPDINIIADIITPFHFTAIIGFLFYMVEKLKTIPVGIIRIHPHSKTGFAIDINSIPKINIGSIIVDYASDDTKDNYLSDVRESFKFVNHRTNEKLYVVAPGRAILRSIRCLLYSNKKVIRVSTDDGLATYDYIEWVKNVINLTGSKIEGMKDYLLFLLYDILRVSYRIKLIKFNVFYKGNFFDNHIVKYYRIGAEFFAQNVRFNPKNEYVIYLGRLFDKEYINRTQSVVENILQKLSNKGFDIYVKLHPRDKNNDGCIFKTIEKEWSIESIVSKSEKKPTLVLGWDSTAMCTLSGFWGIPCYSLCGLLNKEDQKLFDNWNRIFKVAKKSIPELHSGKEIYNDFFLKI